MRSFAVTGKDGAVRGSVTAVQFGSGIRRAGGEGDLPALGNTSSTLTLERTLVMLRVVALRLFLAAIATGVVGSDRYITSVVAQQPLTPGEMTTIWTQPLLPDGGLDFVRATNQFGMRRTPLERNGIVPLLETMGADDFYDPGSYAALRSELGLTGPGTAATPFHRPDEAMLTTLHRATSATWTARQNVELSTWLASNEAALGKIDEAIARGGWFYPMVDAETTLVTGERYQGINNATPVVWIVVREMATALAARSALHYGDGQPDAGLQDLMNLYGLSEMLASGDCHWDLWVALNIEDMAREVVQALLNSNALRPADYSAIYQSLQSRKSFNPDLAILNARDIFASIEMLDGLARGQLREMSHYMRRTIGNKLVADRPNYWDLVTPLGIRDWDQVALDLRQTLAQVTEALRKETYADRTSQLILIDARNNEKIHSKSGGGLPQRIKTGKATDKERGEVVNLAIIACLFVTLNKSVAAASKLKTSRQITLTALLVEAFRQRSGRLPESLDELTPELLRIVPQDPFDSRPLKYRQHYGGYGFQVYSVGVNAKDLGGPDPRSPHSSNFGIVVSRGI